MEHNKLILRYVIPQILILSAVVLSPSVANAQEQTLLTRHVRDAVSNGQAQALGTLPTTQILNFDIVLPIRDQAGLNKFLKYVYEPASRSYRHFLTVRQFTDRFGPTQDHWDALNRFATDSGFSVTGGSRDAMDLQLQGSVSDINATFNITISYFQHPTENRTFYGPNREPTVNLPFRLWHITGLDSYSIPQPTFLKRPLAAETNPKPNVLGSCPSNAYCGSDMRAAYYGGNSLNGTEQTVGLLEYYGYDIADLNTYYENAGQTNKVPVIGISTDGTPLSCLFAAGCDDTEQIIDMTQALGMAPNLAALNVYVGSSDTALLGAMSSQSPLDAQLSASWEWEPSDPNADDPFFQKFAAQGQSYFNAAGDTGGYTPSTYYVWPSDNQYVIVVGGTELETNSAGGPWASETAWPSGGGGYYPPDNIPIPSWQQLPGVITLANEGSTIYRNSPDVSAEANFDFYVCADQTRLHCKLLRRHEFCLTNVGGLHGARQSTGRDQWQSTVGFHQSYDLSSGIGSVLWQRFSRYHYWEQ